MEFKRKKRLEVRSREGREAREKSSEDYHWANLCEDATKLKKAPCARIKQILKTSWTIKTASVEQQE